MGSTLSSRQWWNTFELMIVISSPYSLPVVVLCATAHNRQTSGLPLDGDAILSQTTLRTRWMTYEKRYRLSELVSDKHDFFLLRVQIHSRSTKRQIISLLASGYDGGDDFVGIHHHPTDHDSLFQYKWWESKFNCVWYDHITKRRGLSRFQFYNVFHRSQSVRIWHFVTNRKA